MEKVIKKLFFLIVFFFSVLLSSYHVTPNVKAQTQISNWSSLNPLPYEVASQTSFITDNKFFIIGGSAALGVNKPIPLFTTINHDGSISNWTPETTPVPVGLIWHSTAVKDDYVYIIGGVDNIPGSINSNLVYRGVLDASRSLGSWIAVNSLPKRLALGEATVIGSKLYYAGGRDHFGMLNDQVYYAVINPNGTIGPWSIAGLLPYPVDGFSMIEANNSLIILGGNTNSGFTANVWKTGVNFDGTLQVWTPLPSLPVPLYRAGVTKVGNVLVVAGGVSTSSIVNTVYFTELDTNGDYSAWNVSDNPLPRVNCCSPLVAWNNHLYLTGGHDGGYYSDVLTAEINSPTPTLTPTPAEEVTFSGVLEAVDSAEESRTIQHRTAVLLRVTLKNAEKDYNAGKIMHAVQKIDLFKEIIVNYKKEANNPVLEEILEDVDALKEFIQTSE